MAGRQEDDWLLKQLNAVVEMESRKVRFDPCLDDSELLQLIDDELSGRPPTDLESRPDEYVNDYVNRLQRFCSSIDYLLGDS